MDYEGQNELRGSKHIYEGRNGLRGFMNNNKFGIWEAFSLRYIEHYFIGILVFFLIKLNLRSNNCAGYMNVK